MRAPVDSTVRIIEDLFFKFESRRLAMVLFIVGTLAFIVLLIEHYSGCLYLWRIDRQAEILLQLEESVSAGNDELEAVADRLSDDLSQFENRSSPFSGVTIAAVAKFMTGGLLGLLFLLVALFPGSKSRRRSGNNEPSKSSDSKGMLLGGIMILIPLGVVGLLIPTFAHWSVNAVAYSMFWSFIIWMLNRYQRARSG